MGLSNISGTITAIVTPFTKKGIVDFKQLENLIEFQIENGVQGIVVCGSTGESATLKLKEKQEIIIKSVEISAGRLPVIAATGTYETEQSIELSKFAQDNGSDAVLIVAPYYLKPTQDGLFKHYKLIADSISIPVIIYNIPGRTGVNIKAETQLKIANCCKNVIATKEASSNLMQMMDIIANAPKGFSLLSGDDSLTLPIIAVGGKGVISVISNYAPKQYAECINLALKGKFKEAQKIHYSLYKLMELNFIEPNPVPAKYALSLMKMVNENIRMPLLPLKDESKQLIKKALKEQNFI